jgi:hypothetical protein
VPALLACPCRQLIKASLCTTAISCTLIHPAKSPELPLSSQQTPQKFAHAKVSINQLQEDLQRRQLSSPIRSRIETVFKGTKPLLQYGELIKLKLEHLHSRMRGQQIAKSRNRKVIQRSGALTVKDTLQRIAAKEAGEKEQVERKRQKLIQVTHNKIKKELKSRGIIAHPQERMRLQQVREFSRNKNRVENSIIPPELLISIPDPEKTVTNEDIELQLRETLITMPEFSVVDITATDITTEPTGGLWHPSDPRYEFQSQLDYISFGTEGNIPGEEEAVYNY